MSNDVLRWGMEELGAAALVEDPSGHIEANGPARSLVGEPEGHTLAELLATLLEVPAESELLLETLGLARCGERSSARVGGRRLVVAPVADGSIWAAVGASSDEEREHIRQRAAAAELAAGVSHEVHSALTAIVGWAQLALERPDRTSPREALQTIIEGARAAREASAILLQSVRRSTDDMEPTEVGPILRDVERLVLPAALKRKVDIRIRMRQPCWMRARRGEVFIAVWNLARNAIEAMRDGGLLIMSAHERQGRIRIGVQDTGPGMDERTQQSIFKPYFTTRAEGTGLGLHLVRRMVEGLGGEVLVDSELGHGTRFTIDLQATANPVRQPCRSGTIPRANVEARILVVEDDSSLRGLVATTLELRGAQVSMAESIGATEALEGPFDVAIVDMALPDGRGDEAIALLRRRGVSRIVAMTGGEPPSDLLERPDSWLRKPFEPIELLERVTETLGVPASPLDVRHAR